MFGKSQNIKKYFISILGLIAILIFSVQLVYGAEYTIKFGENWPIESSRGKTALLFKEIVERASEGDIKVEVYPSAQLGTQEELTDAVKMGSVEMAWCYYPPVNEKFIIISMPFLFENWEQAIGFLNSPFIEKLKEESKENGYYVAAMFCEPPRNITNNVRPIEKPDDLKGLLLRVPPLDILRKSVETLGASPQKISYSDVYMALKTGVVDGQENPLLQIKDSKFYEVQEYLSLVQYTIFPGILCLNLDFYESLPSKYQKLIDYAAQSAADYLIWYIEAELGEYEQFLREKMIVNEITPENHKLFVEKLLPLWQEYINDGYFTQEDINEIKTYLENKN